MASIFNSLNIGYSGLNSAQVGINVTGNNIANAETEGYSRQRVVNASAAPLSLNPGQQGNGVEITEIARIFDNFVFDRYTASSEKKENSDFMQETLTELSTYFPEIDNVGIKADMQEYFNMWQSFADNPDNDAVKIALSSQTNTLTNHIQSTRTQVSDLQKSINNELSSVVNEVNRKAQQIADLNGAIDAVESDKVSNANDLKDKRNVLERDISKLIGGKSFSGLIESNTTIDSNANVKTGSYSLLVSGYNIVDGPNVHKLIVDDSNNPNGLYGIYFERQDAQRFDMTNSIKSGKAGGILEMRGSDIDPNTNMPTNGFLQETIDQLDTFAAGLIEHTNNLYAQSSTTAMQSNTLDLTAQQDLLSSNYNVNAGSFDINVFSIDGDTIATKTINIDELTSMDNGTPQSILGQISAQTDDNQDNNATNDIDDMLQATFINGTFGLELKSEYRNSGLSFNISDNYTKSLEGGTNFAGAVGANRFFDGDNANSISVNMDLKNNPLSIKAHAENIQGNNDVAINMIQLQFENVRFTNGSVTSDTTLYGYYDTVSSTVGSRTNAEIIKNDSLTAQFNSTKLEHQSISKVSMDEELTNLIRYQTAYGAAAKVITTIDQMMNTLLGIKQ